MTENHPSPTPSSQPMPQSTLQRIHRSVLADDVYEAIKALIMDHSIPPGERIGIESIARQLDVSPTPVREALARLEAERLVSKEPLKGYRTTALITRDELIALFDFRLIIEPWAAAQAARVATESQRVAISTELEEHGVAPGGARYADYRELTDHDRRFHSLLFETAGNPYAERALESLHVHLHLFRLHYGQAQGPTTIDEHVAVVDAVFDGKPDRAATAMRRHLTRSRDRLLTMFTDHPNHQPPNPIK